MTGNEGIGQGAPTPQDAEARAKLLRKQKMLRALKWAGAISGALTVIAIGSVVWLVAHYSEGLPSVEQLKTSYAPPQVTRIFARDGTVLANVFTERRTVIPFSEIPDHVKLAFLAAEDAHFYEHEGLNYFGMLRALAANFRARGTRQGGSTITQQVVKNVLLESERTYRRKIRETILARRLEQHLSKDEILSLYLNHIYLGHGRYGVEEASRYYFGKKARAIDLAEAALLAGLIAAPERLSPRTHPERALSRRRYVLDQMLTKGFITPELHRSVVDQPVRLAPAVDAESELCPEVVELANKTLDQVAGDQAKRGGFQVYTSIDPRLQAAARRAVRDNLDQYMKRQKLEAPYTATTQKLWGKPFSGMPKQNHTYVGVVDSVDDKLGTIDVRVGDIVGRVFLAHENRYNAQGLAPSRFTRAGAVLRVSLLAAPEAGDKPPLRLELGPESALVAIDIRNRDVAALVGSYEALAAGLDRATQSRRQPGSSFKAFVYSYALYSRRFTAATMLTVPDSHHKGGEPAEHTISVRDALAKSDNAAAVRVMKEVGPANVVRWAHACGIESRLEPDESLALGSYEVTPLEMANAYATFASGGEYAPPNIVTRVVGPGSKDLALPPAPPRRTVMQAEEAYLSTSLMRSVVEYGTGTRARSLGRPVAGKTGTTNQSKDAWFVGYSTDWVVAVWIGYDDALPLGPGESGAVAALPAWVDFMKTAHESRPVTEFTRPSSIVVVRIDPASGLLAREGQSTARDEEFLQGTEPNQLATDGGAPPTTAVTTGHDAGIKRTAADAGHPIEEEPPF